ncbi:MAG TPA: CHASE2 domain-containing protein, partial [Candidatus Obscuribacterales bacterium]
AESLINLGLSQVAVMREPIHNAVAEKFLVRFMQELATYKDVHAAMLSACIELKVNHNLTFPSAYLILSLFRHPEAPLFRLKPWGGKQWLQSVLPSRQSAIALSTLLFISLIYPVQDVLLEQRLWVQTIYRDITGQVPTPTTPPVLLVQIDQKSLQRSGISSPNPIDRRYLSKLVDKLSANNSRIVGLDYVLDLQQPGKDELLGRSILDAVKRGNWFVFAAKEGAEADVREENKIASRNWSLHGYINTHPWYVELLPANAECNSSCPFAYLLALAYGLNQQPLMPDIPRPQLQSQGDFRGQVIDYLNSNSKQNPTVAFLKSRQARLHPIATFSELFDQLWLKPLIDFSIPPNQVYQRIPAWQLLEDYRLPDLQEKVVIIAAGGYDQAGVTTWGEDNFPVPLAIAYWRERLKSLNNEGDRTTVNPQVFTGSEAIAYTIHHLLKQRLVIPIPDLWMIAVAVLLGQGTILILQRRRLRRGWLVGVTVAYGLVSLQVYISAAVLLPVLLPSAALWVCVLGRRWQRRG